MSTCQDSPATHQTGTRLLSKAGQVFPASYRSPTYVCDAQLSSRRHLASLVKWSQNYQKAPLSYQDPETTYQFVEKLAQKFEFGLEALALGIHLYNRVGLERHLCPKDWELYSSVCLMVAAKAIDLDKNVPYYSRYLRYADKTRPSEDYIKAEQIVVKEVGFNLQIPTFVTYVGFYLSNGIMFTDDQAQEDDVELLEERVNEIVASNIKRGRFLGQDQHKLAARIIFQAREQQGFKWNKAIEQYSLLSPDCFLQHNILRQISLQPHQAFNGKLRSRHSLGNNSQQSKLVTSKLSTLSKALSTTSLQSLQLETPTPPSRIE